MIDISSINRVDMEGIIILRLVFFLLLFYTVNYYINLPKDIKEVKGFILGQFGGYTILCFRKWSRIWKPDTIKE